MTAVEHEAKFSVRMHDGSVENSPQAQLFSKQAPYFLSHDWCLVLHMVQYLKTHFVSSCAII